jgi:hypothetical protein
MCLIGIFIHPINEWPGGHSKSDIIIAASTNIQHTTFGIKAKFVILITKWLFEIKGQIKCVININIGSCHPKTNWLWYCEDVAKSMFSHASPQEEIIVIVILQARVNFDLWPSVEILHCHDGLFLLMNGQSSGKSDKYLLSLSRLIALISLFQHFKLKLRSLSKIYLPQVGSSHEFDLFLTYLHLFRNKCAKYKLQICEFSCFDRFM